jgi:hypothetical protein
MKKTALFLIAVMACLLSLGQQKETSLKAKEKRNLRYVSETLFPGDWEKSTARISYTGTQLVITEDKKETRYSVGEEVKRDTEDDGEIETHAWFILDEKDKIGIFSIMRKESTGDIWVTILFGSKGITYRLTSKKVEELKN